MAQGSNLPLDNYSYHILDRIEIKTGIPAPYHSSLKYYTRGAVANYAIQVDTSLVRITGKDRLDLYYLFKENNEWLGQATSPTTLAGPRSKAGNPPVLSQIEASLADSNRYILSRKPFLKHFYNTPANFFELNENYFHLRFNPILNFKIGGDPDEDQNLIYNLRGAELRAGIDDRIYLYFSILETQASFQDYVNQRIERDRAIPGNGFFKDYEDSFFNINQGYDFLNGQGYLAFNISPHVGLQFGYGRNFIGNGYRSVLLSDFSNNYLYLKLNWKVWRFHYQNIFAELSLQANEDTPEGEFIPKKYMAAHHFSFDILPNLNFGIFETVIFSRPNNFEFQYLNPVILYRTVEQSLGSADNVLLGFDARWNFAGKFQLYGQFILDEFKFNELITNNQGWWGNKYAYQLGWKYIDVLGVDHLDLQVELNGARPYTFTHRDSLGTANYTHYNQPLAHPLGANFREVVFKARYQPIKKLYLDARLILASFGEDSDTTNWGGNILLSDRTREQQYNNETTQGIMAQTTILGLDVSYQLRHNFFIDLHFFYREKDSEDDLLDDSSTYVGGGFRLNIGNYRADY